MEKPKRYRDVLALLKQLSRNSEVSSEALRAVLAGNIGEGYTQADIQRTHELAREYGWELSLAPLKEPTAVTHDQYRAEIRRLNGLLRSLRNAIDTANKRLNEVGAKRQQQIAAAGVRSVDEAFERLELFRAHIVAHGACHGEMCGDDPSLDLPARQAFLRAHRNICTCGTVEVFALANRDPDPPVASPRGGPAHE